MRRMTSSTLRLVLLVSCAHALLHVFELSFGTVELLVADEFGVGKRTTGMVASCFRLPFGLGAVVAGWLADRLGEKRLLVSYLVGAAAAALLAWYSPTLGVLVVAMFLLGCFTSIYHPAGVALISHHTTPENRALALGYHGIFGSAGVAAGPLVAGLALSSGASWRGVYLVLTLAGLALAALLAWRLVHGNGSAASQTAVDAGDPARRDVPRQPECLGPAGSAPGGNDVAATKERLLEESLGADLATTAHDDDTAVRGGAAATPGPEDAARWGAFALLVVVGSLAGVVYASITTFLPRYLDQSIGCLWGIPAQSTRNYASGLVLLIGVLGQYTAGRLARPRTLEAMLALAMLGAAPCVAWMALATGWQRLVAAALFALFFFMHQPLFNTLVAKYTPRRRRSFGYGLAFAIGFSFGSLGPALTGRIPSERLAQLLLAVLLLGASATAGWLWRLDRRAAA